MNEEQKGLLKDFLVRAVDAESNEQLVQIAVETRSVAYQKRLDKWETNMILGVVNYFIAKLYR